MNADFSLSQQGAGVFMVQGPASNWVIMTENDVFTLIDGGYPSDTGRVLESIKHLGLDPRAAQAMLITHGHVDHTGAANYFADEFGTPVLSSEEEHPQLLGTERFQVAPRQIIMRAWNPKVFIWMLHVIRSGGRQGTNVPSAGVWSPVELAKLPGSPVPLATPGHTPGHTAFHLPGADVLVSGDALVTGHPISHVEGPQMLHPMFHSDVAGACAALEMFDGIMAETVIPGHGPAFKGTPRDAVAVAIAKRCST